ncbi:MAG TPA: MmcQ/YjbR family DNA-binding protein [Vicinamibacterales bacterium]|nr:MmcQ/YjbR family DNA-binding protein [Vicinamibacterales bacterium]
MRRSSDLFDRVRRLARGLPDVEEGTAWGAPALKLQGRMLACMATHRSAEPGTLVVCVDFGARDELIAADPETYYLREHYVHYPSVLVRLASVRDDALRDLLLMACRFAVARGPLRSATGARRRPRGTR